jgi:2-iminobutanoate/2-iminopropanoate deaminase
MKQIIYTQKAPEPIGPYSQAILVGNTLYTSGQIALDPETMHLILHSVEEETERVMKNLQAVLEAADMTFENVIKTTIFLCDMEDFAKVNTVYGSYFNEKTAPARETVQVADLPKSVNVEISMIAIK